MRQLNLKFIFGLAFAALLICGGVYAVWAYNVNRTIAEFQEKAVAAEQQGKLKEAVGFYRQYLNHTPTDVEQLGKVALIAAKVASDEAATPGDQNNAFRLLTKALRSMPENNGVRRELVEVLVRRRMFPDAQKQILELEKQGVVDSELDFFYATCSAALNQYDEALDWLGGLIGFDGDRSVFDQRLASAPEMLKAYALFAAVLRQRETGGRDDEMLADAAIEHMVATNPEAAKAFLIRGDYLQDYNQAGTAVERTARFTLAQESMRTALGLDQENVDVLIGNANLAAAEDDYEAAHEYLRKAQEIAPDDPRVYIDRATISRLERDTDASIGHLQAGLEVLPDNLEIALEMLEARLIAKQPEQARAVVEQMRKKRFRAEQVELAEAKLMMLDEKWLAASEKLEALRPLIALVSTDGTTETDSLLARCYALLGQPDRQLEIYNRLLSINSRAPGALAGKAAALMSVGQVEEAYDIYRLLRHQIGRRQFELNGRLRDDYMQLLRILGRNDPRYLAELRQMREGVYSSEGVEDIDKALVKIRTALIDGHIDEALELLKAESVKHPNSPSLQDLYLSILVKQNGSATALAYLNEALHRENDPWEDRAEFLVRRAEWIGSIGGPEVLEKLNHIEAEIETYEDSERPFLWQEISKAYYSLNPSRLGEVKRCLRRASELDPENRWTVQRLFELAMQKNDEQEMLAALATVADHFGKDSDLWIFLQARYRLWKYDQQEDVEASLAGVEQLIDRLAVIRPRWNKLLQLRGALAHREDRIDEAIDFYKESFDLSPIDDETVTQLAELLVREQRFEEVRQVLVRMDPVPANMERVQILAETMSGDQQKARRTLDEPEWIESKRAEDWIWRGRLLAYLGQEKDAEKSFRQAVSLEPESSNAAEMLVNYLMENDRFEDAQREIRRLENRLPEKGRGAEVLAKYYCRQQLMKRTPLIAEHYIKQVVDADPENLSLHNQLVSCYAFCERTGAAIEHLNKLVEEKLVAGVPLDPLAIWARRTLARLLVKQADYRAFQQALGLLEANRIDGVLSAEDVRVKGLELALRNEPVYRQGGMSFLENIPPQRLTRREQLALARLYFTSGRWRDCRELMEKLISSNPNNLGLLASYVEMLVEQKEVAQSQRWLRKLEAAAPGNLGAVRLAALVADLTGKKRRAAKMIQDVISKNGQPVNFMRVLAIARIYEELEFYTEAEEQYRLAADQDESTRLELAAYLGRRAKIEESLQICSELLSKETVRKICAINNATAKYHGEQITPEQIQQMLDWVAYGKKEYPDAWDLPTQEAFLLDSVGKTAEALDRLNQIPWDRLTEFEKGLIANNRAYLKLKIAQNDDQLHDDLEMAFEILGPQVELLDTRAMAALQQGDCAEAIRDLKEATLFHPDSGRLTNFWRTGTHVAWDITKGSLVVRGVYQFHLALAYQCQDDKPAARAALETAEALGFEESDVNGSELTKYHELRRWLGYTE